MTRVLVADDDAAVAESVAEFLHRAGFDAAAETSAARLLPVLRAAPPDILLQDVRMPGLDLPAHLRAVRADPALRGVAVVLCSASVELPDLVRALRPDGVLEKPFRGDHLLAYLRALGRHEAPAPG